MAYYLIRVGEGSKYIDQAFKGGYVAIGWEEVSDLKNLKNLNEIKEALQNTTYNYSSNQIGQQAGQIYRFAFEMKNGDRVLCPKGGGEYYVGEVGDYFYEKKPKDGCHFIHRRKVEWIDQLLLKEDFSTNLSYSIGATLTIFSLGPYSLELDALISGKKPTPAEKPERVRDVILTALLELNGMEFEHFIKHLLDIIGFRADVTQYVGDKGIDVVGALNAGGLAEIKLQVQAKRYQKGSLGGRIVREMKGTLGLDEHGCIITTASFSKDAVEEAEKQGHKTIRLIDGNDLAALILKNFDLLDDSYKSKFQIKKRKDFNVEDQFEVSQQVDLDEIEEEEVSDKTSARKTRKQRRLGADTLICAAKEDGFKRAFLKNKAWWAVRIKEKMIPQIKYIAMYQVAPISKLTHYGEVDRIEPYEDTGKYKIYLRGEPMKFKNAIALGDNRYLKPQGPKYAQFEKVENAKTLDDIWN